MGKEIIEEIEERPDGSKKIVKRSVEKGVTFGSVLAMVISFATWKSVGWAIVHGLMGWVYVVYFLIRYRQDKKKHFCKKKCFFYSWIATSRAPRNDVSNYACKAVTATVAIISSTLQPRLRSLRGFAKP